MKKPTSQVTALPSLFSPSLPISPVPTSCPVDDSASSLRISSDPSTMSMKLGFTPLGGGGPPRRGSSRTGSSRKSSIDPTKLVRMDRCVLILPPLRRYQRAHRIHPLNLGRPLFTEMIALTFFSSVQEISCSVGQTPLLCRCTFLTNRIQGSPEGPWNHSFRLEQ